jgi:hypothetical protein
MRKVALGIGAWLMTVGMAEPHWVEVGRPIGASGPSIVYLDDSAVIHENNYTGLRGKTILAAPGTVDGAQITAVITIFEVDCGSGNGRGKRVSLLEANGAEHPGDQPWRTIDRPPATDTINAVKLRVCVKAY